MRCCENVHKFHVFRCDNDFRLDSMSIEAHFMRGPYVVGFFAGMITCSGTCKCHYVMQTLAFAWISFARFCRLFGPVLLGGSVCIGEYDLRSITRFNAAYSFKIVQKGILYLDDKIARRVQLPPKRPRAHTHTHQCLTAWYSGIVLNYDIRLCVFPFKFYNWQGK